MKHTKHLLTLACSVILLGAVSCSKDERENPVDKPVIPVEGEMTFTAQSEDISKVTFDGNTPRWAEGDAIGVFTATDVNKKFNLTDAAAGTFKGSISGEAPYYAIYPYDAATTLSSGVFTATVPVTQTIESGKNVAAGAVVAVAKSDNEILSFKNAVGVMKLTIPGGKIKKVVLESTGGESIAGTFTIDPANPGSSITVTDGVPSINILPSGESFAAGEYFVTMLPVVLTNGFKVTFTNTEDETVSVNGKATEIVRSGGANLGAFFAIEIGTAEELSKWNKQNAKWTSWDVVTLTADIDMSGVADWTPHAFAGTFDGAGHSIYNLVIESADTAAFISDLKRGGCLKNLNFGKDPATGVYDGTSAIRMTASSRTERTMVGLLARATNPMTLENVNNYAAISVDAAVTATYYAGGIAGYSNGAKDASSVSDCHFYGKLSTANALTSSSNYVGGIIGYLDGTMTVDGCSNQGTVMASVSTDFSLGGILGRANKACTLSNCINAGRVIQTAGANSGSGMVIGGIIGSASNSLALTIDHCYNDGEVLFQAASAPVNGNLSVGGIMGYLGGGPSITNCANRAAGVVRIGDDNVTMGPTWGNVGGILGYGNTAAFTLTSCENAGTVINAASFETTGFRLGGIVGFVNVAGATLSGLSNTGTVKNLGAVTQGTSRTSHSMTGGIFGYLGKVSTFKDCTNSGVVCDSSATVFQHLGGIGGMVAGGTLDNCDNLAAAKVYRALDSTVSSEQFISGVVAMTVTTAGVTLTGCDNAGEVRYTNPTGGASAVRLAGICAETIIGTEITSCTNSGLIINEAKCNSTNFKKGSLTLGGILSDGGANTTLTSCTNTGTIKDVSVSNSPSIGGVAGRFRGGTSTLTGCVNEGRIYKSGNAALITLGGLIGLTNTGISVTATDCRNSGAVTNDGVASGAAAPNAAAAVRLGGIVGFSNTGAAYSGCTNSGAVTDSSLTAKAGCYGGIVGHAVGGSFDNCDNSGQVAVQNNETASKAHACYMGGVLGYCDTTALVKMSGCDNAATGTVRSAIVSSANSFLGGIAGYFAKGGTTMETCVNRAKVSLEKNTGTYSYAGGVLGLHQTDGTMTVEDCENYGEVSLTASNVNFTRIGGIVGGFGRASTIKGCTNYGPVNINSNAASGTTYFGGILGGCTANGASIQNSTNAASGKVTLKYAGTLTNANVGGILGGFSNMTTLTISGCHSLADVTVSNSSSSTTVKLGGIFGGGNNTTVSSAPDISGCTVKAALSSTAATNLFIGMLVGGNAASAVLSPTVKTSGVSGSLNGTTVSSTNWKTLLCGTGTQVSADNIDISGGSDSCYFLTD